MAEKPFSFNFAQRAQEAREKRQQNKERPAPRIQITTEKRAMLINRIAGCQAEAAKINTELARLIRDGNPKKQKAELAQLKKRLLTRAQRAMTELRRAGIPAAEINAETGKLIEEGKLPPAILILESVLKKREPEGNSKPRKSKPIGLIGANPRTKQEAVKTKRVPTAEEKRLIAKRDGLREEKTALITQISGARRINPHTGSNNKTVLALNQKLNAVKAELLRISRELKGL